MSYKVFLESDMMDLLKNTDLSAIDISIIKWETIVTAIEDGRYEDVIESSLGIDNCALCYTSCDEDERDKDGCHCHDCPIYEITNSPFCVGTPYIDYNKVWIVLLDVMIHKEEPCDPLVNRIRLSAKSMLYFLRTIKEGCYNSEE